MSDSSPQGILTLTADDPRTWFEVYDHNLVLIASGGGELRLSLAPGLYEVHSERASKRESEILALEPGLTVNHHVTGHAGPVLLPIESFLKPEEVPHATAMIRATSAMRSLWLIGRRRARIVVMLRQSVGSGRTLPIAEHLKAVSLLNPVRREVHKFSNRWIVDQNNGYAITRANVAPGCYTLRVTDSAGVSEQSVAVMAGRQTIVVAPLFREGPQPGLATMIMCHARESWNLIPNEHLLLSESIFSRLRSDRLSITREETTLARKYSDSDPLPTIAAINSLPKTDNLREDSDGSLSQLLNSLRSARPQHPDLQMLLQATDSSRRPAKYPPMFADTYSRAAKALHGTGRSAVSEGSYAENACAAAFQGGVFLRWRTDAITSAKPPSANTRIPRASLDTNRFIHAALESLFQRSTGQVIGQWLVTAALALLAWVPVINRSLSGLMSRKAGWESGNIRRQAAEKVVEYGRQVAALKRGTAALTLTRIDTQALADGTGVPTPISGRIKSNLVANLGGKMADVESGAPVAAPAPPASPPAASAPATPSGATQPATDSAAQSGRPLPVTITAIAVLIAFGVLVAWMLITATTKNGTQWDRQVFIFTSVEAIVFTAAGALFGVEVKRQQASSADSRAEAATARATEALESERLAAAEAEKARALAAATRGALASARAAAAAPPGVPGGARAPVGAAVTSDAALNALGNIANELFPPT